MQRITDRTSYTLRGLAGTTVPGSLPSGDGGAPAAAGRRRPRAGGPGGRARPRRGDVVGGHEMGHPAGAWDLRAAKLLGRDPLARDRLHHLRPGEEQPRPRARHHHEVAERRRVGRAARARPGDDRDPWHARRGLSTEDRRVGVQGRGALLEPGAARVQEADHRRAGPVGEVDRPGDRLPARGAERAAAHRAVQSPGVHAASGHAALARNHAVAHGASHGQERARVAQQVDAGERSLQSSGWRRRRSSRHAAAIGRQPIPEPERVRQRQLASAKAARRARSRGRTRLGLVVDGRRSRPRRSRPARRPPRPPQRRRAGGRWPTSSTTPARRC